MTPGSSRAPLGAPRLHFLDWYRGLACVLMFQTHAYDSWTAAEHRWGLFWWIGRHLGGVPARLFLFLAGVSMMLSYRAAEARGPDAPSPRLAAARRGLEILGIALAFRVAEWLLGLANMKAIDDMLRFDILNCIGVSLMLAAAIVPPSARASASAPAARLALPLAAALLIVALTPTVWRAWPPAWLPAGLAAWVSGPGKLAMFPLFPWTAYLLVGCASGAVLIEASERGKMRLAIAVFTALGLAMSLIALLWARGKFPLFSFGDNVPGLPPQPTAFLYRTGMCFAGLGLAYGLTREDATTGVSAWLRQLGTSSLLVYMVHVELVYGITSSRIKKRLGPWSATLLLIVLTVLMYRLAVWNARRRQRRRARRAAPPASGAESGG